MPHITADPEPILTVRTHATGAAASRLTVYRLKCAAAERDEAIEDAHQQYERKVRAITGRDRTATAALRRGDSANYKRWKWMGWPVVAREPAIELSHPFASEIDAYPGVPTPWWMVNPANLLRRFGYRPTTRYWLERSHG